VREEIGGSWNVEDEEDMSGEKTDWLSMLGDSDLIYVLWRRSCSWFIIIARVDMKNGEE
jgi:hypothetical protein